MGFSDKVKRDGSWIYSSGQVSQITTWEPYLSELGKLGLMRGRYAFLHCVNQHHPLTMLRDFPWDLWEESLGTAGGRQMVVILDSHTEGLSWRHVAPVVERMMGDGVDPRCIIHWTGGSHEPNSPIQTVTTMDAFSIITPARDCIVQETPTHHFVMLARVPRQHRVLAAVEILRRGLDSNGYLTCGSGDYPGVTDTSVFDECVPGDLRHRFPMLLPSGKASTVFTAEENSISVRIPEATGAFCNVVCETSHDVIAPYTCTAFATEKSEKAFLLEQVPIWVAPRGQAALAREWGFDLFDDIIDHGYDSEPDPHRRITMAIDQLDQVCSMPLEHWRGYRSTNARRFEHNRRRCWELRKTHMELQYRKLVGCMSRMPPAQDGT